MSTDVFAASIMHIQMSLDFVNTWIMWKDKLNVVACSYSHSSYLYITYNYINTTLGGVTSDNM